MAANTASSDDGDPAQQQSGITPPQLSVPKGGGAIRGIDEKFTTNPVTGTGSFNIPFPLSPGRSGFGPQLSLGYDSGSGNGCFGMGWSASLPMISRRTDKGIPRYRDGPSDDAREEDGLSVLPDIFILSGAEDLVPVLQYDAEEKWRIEEVQHDGYRIQRYRPRIEGLFAQIEYWRSIAGGDSHWRSISKDNTLTLYGTGPDSRIADPANPAHVFSWLVSQSFDNKGNAIIYDYAGEEDAVASSASNERNRVRSANRCLKRIRYGNRIPLAAQQDLSCADWMFEVVFDYGEGHYREDPPDEDERIFAYAGIAARDKALVRKDPFSTYRSGFEIRQYRLCRRVLMFHHFPQELGTASYLVRSMAFDYHEKAVGSFITRIVQCGHKLQAGQDSPYQRYFTRKSPPLTLTYTASPLEDTGFDKFQLHEVAPENLANLAGGIDGSIYRWLDLDAEGIPGVLSEQEDGWFYKPNLGDARFGATQLVHARPAIGALNGGDEGKATQLMDMTGDGNLDLVALGPPGLGLAGFHARTQDHSWEGFRPFRAFPVRDWDDPNLRFVDLTGDGIADVLVTEDDAVTWHPSLLALGFGAGLRVRTPQDEESGPRVIFSDLDQSVYLADMSGDGMSDIVRIRNGEICYWPNLGYGRFGAKITMDNAPRFDTPDLFDQSRIRLADTDGGGTADILYFARDSVRIYLNESGNSWSEARQLHGFPAVDKSTAVVVTDFLGRGTACLLWSSSLPHDAGRQLRYVDLMCGQKPHLLIHVNNNLGAETRLEYASSTEFYLADKAAGTPWITRLPFPVHVVKRVETYDYVSRNRFVSRYSYHHGFYDGVEREFRGFARVDQRDTEEFSTLTGSDAFPAGANLDAASSVPPILTKTWFHTGAFLHGQHISRQLTHEYYREGSGLRGEAELSVQQAAALQLPDTMLPPHLTAEDAREACRSLKGAMLRQEVYALDDGAAACRPYTASENNYTIRLLQKKRDNRHAVFFTHARESLNFNYDRKLYKVAGKTGGGMRADPRVTHGVTLAVDDYGNVLTSVAIAYGRRFPDPSPLLTQEDRDKQAQILLTLTRNAYTNAVHEKNAYRSPLPCEVKLYELINVKPERHLSDVTNFFGFDEIARQAARAGDGAHDIPFEDWRAKGAEHDVPYRRLLKQSRILYRSDRLDRMLPLGVLESLALPGQSYTLAFTPGLLETTFQRPSNDASCSAAGTAPEHAAELRTTPLLPDPGTVLGSKAEDGGGYLDLDNDGCWWVPGDKIFFDPDPDVDASAELMRASLNFFLPRRFENPFGYSITADFDTHDLLNIRTADALANVVHAENDYRVLRPQSVTDANGNRSEVAFDTFGMVAGSALAGKTCEHLGDSLDGFRADLTTAEIALFFANPAGAISAEILGRASTRTVYEPDRFFRIRQPAFSATLSRETHYSDLASQQQSKIQISFSYADGFCREIQQKKQAEPGPVIDGGEHVVSRWIASGWTIFNNKGKPVRQYEPFFDDTPGYTFGKQVGVSPILLYDPVGRLAATLHPNHTFQKTVFDPWRQENWDVNDNVLTSHPEDDHDVGPFFRRLPEPDYLPSWYDLRITGSYGFEEQNTARKTAVHGGTPGLAYADTLGNTVLSIAHNRFGSASTSRPRPSARSGGAATNNFSTEEFYPTRKFFDIQGNQREVIDANHRIVATYEFDLRGERIHQASMEAGERWLLNDMAGKPIRTWDSRQHQFRTVYDALRRPVSTSLRDGDGTAELLVGRIEYGESRPHPESKNLRTKVVQVMDQAGVVRSEDYDFKGNLLHSERQLAREYKRSLDWTGQIALEAAVYSNHTRYDALNRPTALTSPDHSVIYPAYNATNLLQSVNAQLHGSTVFTSFISRINYNAKGLRTQVVYGNDTRTSYGYDPLNFRLMQLSTVRYPDVEQLQSLHYTYDAMGNVTHIRDHAQQSIFFRNRKVEPGNDYSYDAVYRLIEGYGREHLGQIGGAPTPYSFSDASRVRLPQPGDGNAMARYCEQYFYDAVGNILAMRHRGHDPSQSGWKRSYAYHETSQLQDDKHSNRLSAATIGDHDEFREHGERAPRYDSHGNMLHMQQLHVMQWDFKDQLQMVQRQAVNIDGHDGQPKGERTWYVYDAAGRRVRKVTELATGQVKDERIYLGSFETYRKNGATPLVRETLQIMDDKQPIALIETRTEGSDPAPQQLIRYQYANHLGSVCLELDRQARILSYEEYTPYGSTAYQAVHGKSDAPKRYRYSGKERDEESGLYYHGARYYAPWLGLWTSADPIGISGGINLYAFSANNPIVFSDATGKVPTPPSNSIEDLFQFIRNQAGFETGAQRGISFSSSAASPFGTAAHAGATGVVDALKQIGFESADRIYSEVRTVAGVVTQIGGSPGGPKGSFNLDLVAVQPGQSLSVGDNLTSGVGQLVGDIKYGGGVISPKYNALGIPLSTVNGSTVASTTEEVNALVASAAKVEPVVAEAGILSSVMARAAPVLEALAPAAKVLGKIAGPLGAGLSAYSLGEDYAKGDVAHGLADLAGAVSGGLQTFALASTALGAGGGGAAVGSGAVAGGGVVAGGGAAAVAATGAAVVGAFAVGVSVGIGIQEGSAYLSKRYLGTEISPGQMIGDTLTAADNLVSQAWTDPNKPAYTQTIGWRIAAWLTPTAN